MDVMELRHLPEEVVIDGVLDVPITVHELRVAPLEDDLEFLLLLLPPELFVEGLGLLTLVDPLFLQRFCYI